MYTFIAPFLSPSPAHITCTKSGLHHLKDPAYRAHVHSSEALFFILTHGRPLLRAQCKRGSVKSAATQLFGLTPGRPEFQDMPYLSDGRIGKHPLKPSYAVGDEAVQGCRENLTGRCPTPSPHAGDVASQHSKSNGAQLKTQMFIDSLMSRHDHRSHPNQQSFSTSVTSTSWRLAPCGVNTQILHRMHQQWCLDAIALG